MPHNELLDPPDRRCPQLLPSLVSRLSLPPPDISQQEAGGEHGQEKAGQPDEGVQDPRQRRPGQLYHRSPPTCWEAH